MFKVRLQTDSEAPAVEVTVDRIARAPRESHHVHVNGRHFEVELASSRPGEGVMRIAGRVYPFMVIRQKDTLHVWIRGQAHRVTIADSGPRRASAESAAGRRSELTAPMPGTILKVLAGAGDRFESHQPLIVMESMKMEMTISAPHAGRVGRILCAAGQLVEMGALLATLDDADEDQPS